MDVVKYGIRRRGSHYPGPIPLRHRYVQSGDVTYGSLFQVDGGPRRVRGTSDRDGLGWCDDNWPRRSSGDVRGILFLPPSLQHFSRPVFVSVPPAPLSGVRFPPPRRETRRSPLVETTEELTSGTACRLEVSTIYYLHSEFR